MQAITVKKALALSAACILVAYPILLLSVVSSMSVSFVGLVIIALITLIWKGRTAINGSAPDIAFSAAMSSLFLATLFSAIYHSGFRSAVLDSPSRFLLAIIIYFALKQVSVRYTGMLQYGLPLGVLSGFLTSVFFPSHYWSVQTTYFVDPPTFAGAILILGTLSLMSVNWLRPDPLFLVIAKVAAFMLALYCAVKSTERGVWIAVPVLLLILGSKIPSKLRFFVGIGLLLLIAAIYVSMPEISARLAQTRAEFASILDRNLENPIGWRLQMWIVAAHLFSGNLLAGVGPTGVEDSLRQAAVEHHLTPAGLDAALSQIHSEVLAKALALGVPGVLAILAVYLVPLALFVHSAKTSPGHIHRTAGMMGVLLVIAYMIFGLSIETFNLKMTASFYATTVAVLLAIARSEREETLCANNTDYGRLNRSRPAAPY